MQTHETQYSSNQSYFTANKRSRCLTRQEDILLNIECACKIQWYTILMLRLSLLGLMNFVILHTWKLKLCRGHLFSNAVKIVLIIYDEQYYVPVKLRRMVGSIHLFNIYRHVTSWKCKFKKKFNLGYIRISLEGSQHDCKWKQNQFTKINSDKILRQVQN